MLPQFDVATYPSQVFWLIVSLIIIVSGMIFLVLPKYQQLLEARINKIKNEVDTAVYLQKEVIKLKKERLQRISQAEEAARQHIEEVTQKILTAQVEEIKKAQKSHEEMVKKLEKSITNQKLVILDNVRTFIHHSADDIYDKLKEKKDAAS
jgi:F-type H+-transporting ATPase subunit b